MTTPKFEIVRYPQEDGSAVLLFAVAESGMVIASVQQDIVRFGENPNDPMIRAFTGHEAAVDWAKAQCKVYAAREDVDFVERSAERKVMLASGMPAGQRRRM